MPDPEFYAQCLRQSWKDLVRAVPKSVASMGAATAQKKDVSKRSSKRLEQKEAVTAVG